VKIGQIVKVSGCPEAMQQLAGEVADAAFERGLDEGRSDNAQTGWNLRLFEDDILEFEKMINLFFSKLVKA